MSHGSSSILYLATCPYLSHLAAEARSCLTCTLLATCYLTANVFVQKHKRKSKSGTIDANGKSPDGKKKRKKKDKVVSQTTNGASSLSEHTGWQHQTTLQWQLCFWKAECICTAFLWLSRCNKVAVHQRRSTCWQPHFTWWRRISCYVTHSAANMMALQARTALQWEAVLAAWWAALVTEAFVTVLASANWPWWHRLYRDWYSAAHACCSCALNVLAMPVNNIVQSPLAWSYRMDVHVCSESGKEHPDDIHPLMLLIHSVPAA